MICPHCNKPIVIRIDAAKIKQIINLDKKRHTCREIAAEVGCSFASVSRILREKKR